MAVDLFILQGTFSLSILGGASFVFPSAAEIFFFG